MDSLEMLRENIENQDVYASFGLEKGRYGVVTMHRPSNVDDPTLLEKLSLTLIDIARDIPLVFPVHPRTKKSMEKGNLLSKMESSGRLLLPDPLSYIQFMNLVFNSLFAITDSGGLQEETTYLGIPCLTVRENTERPITITHGTNQLCELDQLKYKIEEISRGELPKAKQIELWDGRTADRIVRELRSLRKE
ncbi:MAG: UDP-N-acetylglucosamine 2-epimerase, partial [Nitrospira bacterium SG8_35_4]